MTDPQIPASKPVTVLSSQQSGSAAASGARSQTANLPVLQAPPDLRNPQTPVRLDGRVVSSNPQTQELRIATPGGEVTIQSSANLPPDTPVTIELSTQRGQEVATLIVQRQQAAAATQIEDIVSAPTAAQPPLRPGDVVQAIFIQDPQAAATAAATTAAAASPPDLAEVAQIIQSFPAAGVSQLPGPLPVPAQVLIQVATAANVLTVLQGLSPAQQAGISAYLARPDVIDVLKKFLPDVARSLQLARPSLVRDASQQALPQQALPPEEEDTLDDDILQIVQARTGKLAQESGAQSRPQTPASSVSPLMILRGLMPLLETLQPGEGTMVPLTRQLMPGMSTPAETPLAGLMPQSMYEVSVSSVAAPGQTPLPLKTGELQGTVESLSPSGFPVVRTGNDLFMLKTLSAVTPGTTINFRATALTAQQVIASSRPLETADWFHPLLSDSWPALQETLQAAAAAAPTLAQALRDTIPEASPRLVPTTLFFLAALRIGNIESWLGAPVLQTLRQAGKGNLVDRLTADFGKIAAQTKETVAGDWRAISMPLRHDEGVSQMQFFVRQQHDDKEEKKDDAGGPRPITRFILNLRLSRLGDMQLDGLMHPARLDLIMRSADALPFPMRQDLMQSFQRGLGQVGMQGGISFQTKAESWINIALPHQRTSA